MFGKSTTDKGLKTSSKPVISTGAPCMQIIVEG